MTITQVSGCHGEEGIRYEDKSRCPPISNGRAAVNGVKQVELEEKGESPGVSIYENIILVKQINISREV